MKKVFGKEDNLIQAKVGQTFTIELESNPTTGYQWQEKIDSEKVELIDKQFNFSSKNIGSPGKETFTFKAISGGDSVIRLDYKRSWEEKIVESVEFDLKSQKE